MSEGPVAERVDAFIETGADPRHLDFEMPVSTPIAATRSSTDRVDTPLTYASITTAYRAWSIRRRGSSSSGKNEPLRSFGIPTCRSPALVDKILGRVPLRCVTRSSDAFVAASPDLLGSFGIDELLQRPLGELTD
jgi:hypothetical protein